MAIWSQVPTLMPVICEEKIAGKSGEQGKERQEWETESRSPKRGWIPPHCWVYLSNEVSNVVNMDMFNVIKVFINSKCPHYHMPVFKM